MNKKMKVRVFLEILILLFLIIPFLVSSTVDSLTQWRRQAVYNKVMSKLMFIDTNPEWLFNRLKAADIGEEEIRISAEMFFEEMAEMVTGQKIPIVIPKINQEDWSDLAAINTVLDHMKTVEESKVSEKFYEKVLQSYTKKWFFEDCQAIDQLLNDRGISKKKLKQLITKWPQGHFFYFAADRLDKYLSCVIMDLELKQS